MAKVHVPHLEKKLAALMQRSAEIKTYAALAGRLVGRRGEPLKPNNITVWVSGSEMRAAEQVPDAHIATVCHLFDLVDEAGNPRLEVLCEQEWEEFARQIEVTPRHRLPWRKLLLQAQVRPEFRVVPTDALRGASYDAEEDGGFPLIRINERVRLHLELSPDWALRCERGEAHLMLLIEDPEDLSGFPPFRGASSAHLELTTRSLVIPAAETPGPKITGPAGPQSFYALLTSRRLPQVLYKRVLERDRKQRQEAFAEVLEELQEGTRRYDWSLWRSPFIAYYG
jgi:hypothetical protein